MLYDARVTHDAVDGLCHMAIGSIHETLPAGMQRHIKFTDAEIDIVLQKEVGVDFAGGLLTCTHLATVC